MTISDFSRGAVRQYLRSVVLIDDKLFLVPRVTVSNETITVEGAPALGTSAGNTSSVQDSVVARDDGQREETLRLNQIDAHAVTDGFAREGIICGVYKPVAFPETGFENDVNFKTLLTVCKNADVFILDWNLFTENENAVALLLRRLLHDDNEADSPKPVRFCAIYTAERVDEILDKVFSALKTEDSLAQKDDVKFNLRAGGLTVYAYGKEAATSPCAVQAEDLAKRIITDFAKTYEGIMPALALRGIASIRDNAKRILDRFPAGMDPALVLHSGLTISGQSIAEDVTNLIGDEVSSVLSDLQVSRNEIYDLCVEYVNGCADSDFRQTDDAEINKAIASGADEGTIRDFICRVFKQRTLFPKDSDGAYKAVFSKCKETPNPRFNSNLLKLFRSYVERKNKLPVKFGALSAMFCQRTSYSAKRMLKFGTVVRDAIERDAYYLCLMPACDSIRLLDYEVVRHSDGTEENRQKVHYFPFWKLDEVKDGGMSKAHGLVVKGDDGAYCPLCARGKIRENFRLLKFYSCREIVEFGDDNCVRTTDREKTFEWVAELKAAHIQRMAEFVSREFSRVGLTESEWLRLQVDR